MNLQEVHFNSFFLLKKSIKGGDPTAPSSTVTLLRLRSNYSLYLRHPSPTG